MHLLLLVMMILSMMLMTFTTMLAGRFSDGFYEDLFYYHDSIEDYLEGCSCIGAAIGATTAAAATGINR